MRSAQGVSSCCARRQPANRGPLSTQQGLSPASRPLFSSLFLTQASRIVYRTVIGRKGRDLVSHSLGPETLSRGKRLELDLGERENRAGQVLPVKEETTQAERDYRPEHQAGRDGLLSKNSPVARLLEKQGHAGWDTVEGFYIWRVIGLFPATLLDRLECDERCDPETQQKERKEHILY